MQSYKNYKRFIALIIGSLLLNASCGSSQFKYLTLAPVEPSNRSAFENYESIKEGDVEIILARNSPDMALKKLKTEIKKNEYQVLESIFKRIDKFDYTVFLLKITNKQNKKVVIDSVNLTLEYLGKLVEKEIKPIDEKDFQNIIKLRERDEIRNYDYHFLNFRKNLETEKDEEFFIVFPYKIKEEHLIKVSLKNVYIDNKEYDLEYLFYGADRLEKTKRVCIYGGIIGGTIAVIVGVVAFFTK